MIHSKIETKEMSELEKRLTRINELSENTIGITEIYREMLQLRMAIKMILSKK